MGIIECVIIPIYLCTFVSSYYIKKLTFLYGTDQIFLMGGGLVLVWQVTRYKDIGNSCI